MSNDLSLSDDQRQILDAARSMLDEHYPLSRLREHRRSDAMGPVAQFGAFALALPQEAGGAGFTLVEEALLHVEFGRHLLSPRVMAAAIGARIALQAGQAEMAGRIATGETAVEAALQTPESVLLLDGGEGGLTTFLSSPVRLADLDGTTPVAEVAMGRGRPLSRLPLDVTGLHNMRATSETAQVSGLLACAQLLGVAFAARDLAVNHAKTREQFGRPIGGFQAIKHHCATMTIGVEKLSAQLDMAAMALRDRRPDAAFQVAALSALAPKIALETARLGIQIHGGMGFSAEADAHLYLKHAHLLRQMTWDGDLLSLDAPLAPNRKDTACESL